MSAGRKSAADDPVVPPVDFHPASNGEFCPTQPGERARRAEALWRSIVEDKSKRLGITRRQFANGSCGMAAAFWALNQTACDNGARSGGGGTDASPASGDGGLVGLDAPGYDVTPAMMEDAALARARLSGDEFIFDVQTHTSFAGLRGFDAKSPPEEALDFIKAIFVNSDTTVACLTGTPQVRGHGTSNLDAHATLQEIVSRLGGPRLIFHANTEPERGTAELDYMAAVAETYRVGAWKVYPHTTLNRLDSDAVGSPFLEKARALGIKVVAGHRGISGGGGYGAAGSPRDLVAAAKNFPDIRFLTYHSGWERNDEERQPYDESNPDPRGVDRLIKAVLDNQIEKTRNVYAELGSTWNNLMTDPVAAAHVLGKLCKYLGPDRVVWGTDSVFNPTRAQIAAFRAFTIPQWMQEQYGYPALTPEIRAQIFGLNAAAVYGVDPTATRFEIKGDEVDQLKMAWHDDQRAVPMPDPMRHRGPRTRREFLAFRALEKRHART